MTIPPVQITKLQPNDVLFVQIKPPFHVIAQGALKNGEYLLVIQQQRASSIYRNGFYCYVQDNNSDGFVLNVQIIDMRTVNSPTQSWQRWALSVPYDKIWRAKRFAQPTPRMPPEVMITLLQQDLQVGQAPKKSAAQPFSLAPVMLVWS